MRWLIKFKTNKLQQMEIRNILFETFIKGQKKDLIISVPIENGSVITSEFCPQELLTGGMNCVKAINGESLKEFFADCNLQINAMQNVDNNETLMNIHLGGLMAAVSSHIQRCGRLIFGDLLIYMDCFSLLLNADGFSEKEVRNIYPKLTKVIVDLYPNYTKNSVNLAPLHETRIYEVLNKIS